jgi:hypothetical protein
MTNSDVVLGPRRDDDIPSYLELHERVTKTRSGNRGQGKNHSHFYCGFNPLDHSFINVNLIL